MRPRSCNTWIVIVAAGLASTARAHAPVEEEIDALTRAVADCSSCSDLYLRRGELHRIAGDWDAARADYARAARQGADAHRVALCEAGLDLDRGNLAAAVQRATDLLAHASSDPEALLIRAHARQAQGAIDAAMRDWDRFLATAPAPQPDHYLARARLAAEREPADLEDALRVLDAGVARLGPIVSLARPAAEYARRDPDAARRARATPFPALQRSEGELAAPAVTTSLTRGPYLQRGTSTSALVRWRTSTATASRLRWGTSPSSLTQVVDDAALVTEHELAMTGLAPYLPAYYAVGTPDTTLAGGDATCVYVPPQPPGTPWPTRIWVLGDSGLQGAGQNRVRDAYLAWNGASLTHVWLMLGDNAYFGGTDVEYQNGLFTPYAMQLRKWSLWLTRGNHDVVYTGANNDYYEFFTLPTLGENGGLASGTEAYYAFDQANIHFVCLDSEGSDRSTNGAMLTWLRADLTADDSDWRIAFFHHPPYTKGSHDSDNPFDSQGRMRDMRQNALPILDSLGVDLVLTGHSHSYERSFLLDKHYGLSNTLAPSNILDGGNGRPGSGGAYAKPTLGPALHEGAVHVVAGSSAQTSGGSLNHPAMFLSLNVLGSLVLDVDGDQLLARFLDDAGVVRDYFSIVKGPSPPTDGGGTESRLRLSVTSAGANPLGREHRIAYDLPQAAPVRLTVHDARGRRVAMLASGAQQAGRHVRAWDGRSDSGPLAHGVYWVWLRAGRRTLATKLVLVD